MIKNHVVSLEVSAFKKEEEIKVNGRVRVFTRGKVGVIGIEQETSHSVTVLPIELQAKLSNIVQEIEDYYNGVEEVVRGEVTLGSKKKNPKRSVKEYPEDDPAHNYLPGIEVDDPETR